MSPNVKHLSVCFCFLTLLRISPGYANGPVVVKEDSDVILNCSPSTKENLVSKLFDWKKDGDKEVFLYDAGVLSSEIHFGQDEQFKGRVSYFQEELKNGNASIKITKTKMADSGKYTCIFPRLQPRQEFNIQLVVQCFLKDRTAENIPGTCPKPSIKLIKLTKDWALLQCSVRGAFPKPKVEWQDSSGNILPAEEPEVTERGNSYDIILQTNMTKNDHYLCVVTQEEICHQIDYGILVYLQDRSSSGSTGWIFFGTLLVVVVFSLAVFYIKRYLKFYRKEGSPSDDGGTARSDFDTLFSLW